VEITLLIKSIAGLVLVLGILLYFLFLPAKTQQKPVRNKPAPPMENGLKTDLESLAALIKNPATPQRELEEAARLVLKYHGVIHPKMGLRVHPDFYIFRTLMVALCRHPNTNKDIIIEFDKELNRLNPDYKKEINEAITKGLNARGA